MRIRFVRVDIADGRALLLYMNRFPCQTGYLQNFIC